MKSTTLSLVFVGVVVSIDKGPLILFGLSL